MIYRYNISNLAADLNSLTRKSIATIQSDVDDFSSSSVNESYFDILSSTSHDTEDLNSTIAYSAVKRINKYLYFIKSNCKALQEHIKDKIAEYYSSGTNLSFLLNSTVEDFRSENRLITLLDYSKYAQRTFSDLSAFIKAGCIHTLQYNSYQHAKLRFNFNVDNIQSTINITDVLNCQNDVDSKGDTIIDFYNIACANQLMNLSDILYILSMFIQKLKNTKYINFVIKERTSDTTTNIEATGKYEQPQYFGGSTQFSKKNVSLTIGSYIENTKQNTDTILINIEPERNKYIKIDSNMVIPELYLVYDISSGASTIQNIPLKPSGTNGILATELQVNKNNIFNLNIKDIQKKFNLEIGKIASRNLILKAIDYIFQYWLQNMSNITYVLTVCHDNCHTNRIAIYTSSTYSVKDIAGSFKVHGDLHVTKGCGCSTQLYATVNVDKFISQVVKSLSDDERAQIIKYEISIIVGGYCCMMATNPASVTVSFSNGTTTNTLHTRTAQVAGSTGICNIPTSNQLYLGSSGNKVIFQATPADGYFCIRVFATIYYARIKYFDIKDQSIIETTTKEMN